MRAKYINPSNVRFVYPTTRILPCSNVNWLVSLMRCVMR